jgi:hypothetical protein
MRRFLVLGAACGIIVLGLFIGRVSCLDGTVYWTWGFDGEVVRICEGQALLVYLVVEHWPFVVGGLVLVTIMRTRWRDRVALRQAR